MFVLRNSPTRVLSRQIAIRRKGRMVYMFKCYRIDGTYVPLIVDIDDGKKMVECQTFFAKYIVVPDYIADKVYGRFVQNDYWGTDIIVKMDLNNYNMVLRDYNMVKIDPYDEENLNFAYSHKLTLTVGNQEHTIDIPTSTISKDDSTVQHSWLTMYEYILSSPVYIRQVYINPLDAKFHNYSHMYSIVIFEQDFRRFTMRGILGKYLCKDIEDAVIEYLPIEDDA